MGHKLGDDMGNAYTGHDMICDQEYCRGGTLINCLSPKQYYLLTRVWNSQKQGAMKKGT